MQRYLAALTIVVLLATVLARVAMLRRQTFVSGAAAWLGVALRPGQPVTDWVVISQMYQRGVMRFQHTSEDACGGWDTMGPIDPTSGDCAWLDAYEPVARVGRAVLVYDIPPPR